MIRLHVGTHIGSRLGLCTPAIRRFSVLGVFSQKNNNDSHNHSHSHGQGHSHDHSHSVFSSHSHSHSSRDNVLVTEHGGLRNPAIRITWIGILVNIGMAGGKAVGGVVFNSQALLADSVHALSDLVSDMLTLATVSFGSKKSTAMYPYGSGKVETLGSLGVSTLLILAGVSMGWSGMFTMIHHAFGDVQIIETISSVFGHGHSHSHAHDDKIADLNAAWIALISIGVKEWIFAATMKVAKRTGSKVLVANAWHHRIDSLVSMVAVVTIGGGYFWGIKWLDPLGGLIVSSMIVRAGYTTAKSSVLELIDNNSRVIEDGKFEEHREQVQELLRREFDSRYLVSKIELMPSGPSFISNIELTPTAKLESLREFQENCHLIKCKLAEVDPMLVRINITVQDPDSHI